MAGPDQFIANPVAVPFASMRSFTSGLAACWLVLSAGAHAQTVVIDTSPGGRQQVIDGFGTCLSGASGSSAWFQQLFYDELAASILRVDLTPPFVSPYSDLHYNSPWYGQTPSITNGGPEGNYVRTYTGPADYTRSFGSATTTLAVMGPDIDANVQLFDYAAVSTQGAMAQQGLARKSALGDFKLYGSLWSPAPWLKISSGRQYGGGAPPYPAAGTPWPFVWGGNFAGGRLDTSDTPLAVFDDSARGGAGPTSALTQFARGLAAYLRGFQNTYGVKFFAISIQNEVNFEEFYNSCAYPLSSQYLAALKAARAELDRYADLRDIQIAGPEDLLGGDAYGLWQYGSGGNITHKNLQYLQAIDADPAAAAAISFFNVHGYDANGASSAGANPQLWAWWANGWTSSPAAGLPAQAKGFTAYGKKSWMTETSGEAGAWLSPTSGFPSNGAWSLALKLHQALTTGRQSAWLYWQLAEDQPAGAEQLSDATALGAAPKLVAVKHFFRHVRPGAQRVDAAVTGSTNLLASAYLHLANGTLTVVLINTAAAATTATLVLPPLPANPGPVESWTSRSGSLWSAATLTPSSGQLSVPVPGYGVVTLLATGVPQLSDGGSDAGSSDGGGAQADGGGEEGGSGGGGGGQSPDVTGACGCGSGPPQLGALVLLALALKRRPRRGDWSGARR